MAPLFSNRDIGRISKVVRTVEAGPLNARPREGSGRAVEPAIQVLFVTGSSATEGRYPAIIQRYDEDANTVNEATDPDFGDGGTGEAFCVHPAGEELTSGYYLGRPVGEFNGVPVFLVQQRGTEGDATAEGNGCDESGAFSGARVLRSIVATGTSGPVEFEEAEFDKGGYWDAAAPERLTAPASGWYAVGCNLSTEAASGNPLSQVNCRILLNGSSVDIARQSSHAMSAATDFRYHKGGAFTVYWFQAGEYVRFVQYAATAVTSKHYAATGYPLVAWMTRLDRDFTLFDAARIHASGTQATTNDKSVIVLDDVLADTGSYAGVDSRLTAQTGGYYLVGGSLRVNNGTWYDLAIRKNGTTDLVTHYVVDAHGETGENTDTESYRDGCLMTLVRLEAGDYVEMTCDHWAESGGVVTNVTGASANGDTVVDGGVPNLWIARLDGCDCCGKKVAHAQRLYNNDADDIINPQFNGGSSLDAPWNTVRKRTGTYFDAYGSLNLGADAWCLFGHNWLARRTTTADGTSWSELTLEDGGILAVQAQQDISSGTPGGSIGTLYLIPDNKFLTFLVYGTDATGGEVYEFPDSLQASPERWFLRMDAGSLGTGYIETVNGLTGPDITIATANDTNVTLTTTASGSTVTITAGWTGDLAFSRLVQSSAASRLVGRGSAAGAGDYQEITLGAGLSMSGTALSATVSDGDKGDITVSSSGTVWNIDANAVGTTEIADNNVTLAKLATQAEATVIGVPVGGGTVTPVALTAAQLVAIINTADGAGSGLDADLLDGMSSAAFATAAHVHDAAVVTYTPAVLADWDSAADPGDVDNALDQLAERITDAEGSIAASDVNVKVTASDTTTGYLDDKLGVTANGGVAKATANGGGNEQLRLAIDINGMTATDIAPADVLAIYDDSLTAHRKVTVERALGYLAQTVFDFRLTTESGVAVSTSDRNSQGTIYLTPYQDAASVSASGSGRLTLYDGTRWKLFTSAEMSHTISASADTAWDLFCYDNAGTPALEALTWTNSTTRATGLALQDGVLVKSGDATRRYVGSYYTIGANATQDSEGFRYLYSYYHPVMKSLKVVDVTNSWNYTSATLRAANGSTSNSVQVFTGVPRFDVELAISVDVFNSGAAVNVIAAVSLDGGSTLTGNQVFGGACPAAGFGTAKAFYRAKPTLGRVNYQWAEMSDAAGTTTWYGDNGGGLSKQSGMIGSCWC
jgi:hypothetical protein